MKSDLCLRARVLHCVKISAVTDTIEVLLITMPVLTNAASPESPSYEPSTKLGRGLHSVGLILGDSISVRTGPNLRPALAMGTWRHFDQ